MTTARHILAAGIAIIGFVCLTVTGAMAHSQSYGFLKFATGDASVNGTLALAARDLNAQFRLDSNGDGRITWGEIRLREAEIATAALGQIAIGAAAGTCRLAAEPLLTDTRGGEAYVVIPFAATCPVMTGAIKVDYHLLFAIDAQHRGLVAIATAEGGKNFVMMPEAQSFETTADSSWAAAFLSFVVHGAQHIWMGYDHILFLLTLLFGTATFARNESIRDALIGAVKVVTAFTLSHSVTLGFAATGLLKIPVPVAESLIAVTIVLAAINNVWTFMTRRIWLIALAFGLIHGVGFANVLADLGLGGQSLLSALLAFNIGVELGQLVIVAVALPVILGVVRLARNYPRALSSPNIAIGAVGAMWFSDRALGTGLLWF